MNDTPNSDAGNSTEIPAAVGERLQTALSLNQRPQTLGEWGEMMGEIVSREDIDVGLNALCTTDQSPHKARFDGTTQHFVCVQDAFIVPYVVNEVDTVEITTESPVNGEQIEATIVDDGVTTDPTEAVMSFGVAADVSPPSESAGSPEIAYGKICPYGHAFVNRQEYEKWSKTVDAVTMVTPLEEAFLMARSIGRATD